MKDQGLKHIILFLLLFHFNLELTAENREDSNKVSCSSAMADFSVDIIPDAQGAAPQTYSEKYGTNVVYFKSGTKYELEVKNNTRKPVAANITVDGRKVNLTPMLFGGGSKRLIKGFTLARSMTETNVCDRHTHEVSTTHESFIAVAPQEDAHLQQQSFDDEQGRIVVDFFKTKYVSRPEGSHQRRRATREPPRGQARPGILVTKGGGEIFSGGTRRTGISSKRKPLGDLKRPLESLVVTICEQTGAAIVIGVNRGRAREKEREQKETTLVASTG